MAEGDSIHYRDLYLEEKFKGLNEKLDAILETRKSDEKWIESLENRIVEVQKIQQTCPVTFIQQSFDKHMEENKKEIGDLKKVIEDVDYYKRHPGQMKYLIIGVFVLVVLSIIPTGIIIYQLITKQI